MKNNKIYKILVIGIVFACVGVTVSAQNSYPTFYESPKESYVKSMKDVFEELHSRKWEKAQKDYNKLEEKSTSAKSKSQDYTNTQLEALSPLPQLAKAIMLSADNTMIPSWTVDYNKAYYFLKQAVTFPKQNELSTFLKDPDVGVNLLMLQDKIENELCKSATAANTEQSYDAVIDSLLPQSLNVQTMKTQREELVFEAVIKNPTEQECERFLKKYTDAQPSRRNMVSHSLDSIHYSAVDGTIAGLEQYISQYPKSSYLKKAKDSLELLEYQNVDSTAASCRTFLQKYPSSQYTMDVTKRLQKYAYHEAISAGTGSAYLAFCEEFPYDVRFENVFDSLMARTVTNIYDTVFVGKQPDVDKLLSSSFLQKVKNREAAEKQMTEKGMILPKRRDMWTGMSSGYVQSLADQVSNVSDVLKNNGVEGVKQMEIVDFNIKSKTTAEVHLMLNLRTGTTGKTVKSDIYMDFIIEGKELKLDDIRLDGGKSSQKNGM